MKNLLLVTLAFATISCNRNPTIGKDMSGTYNLESVICRNSQNQFSEVAKFKPDSGSLKIDGNNMKAKYVSKNKCSFETKSNVIFNAYTGVVQFQNIQYGAALSGCIYDANLTKETSKLMNSNIEIASDLKQIENEKHDFIKDDSYFLLSIRDMPSNNKSTSAWRIREYENCYNKFVKAHE